MKSVYRIIGISLLAIIVLSVGCVKRDNPASAGSPPCRSDCLVYTSVRRAQRSSLRIWNQFPARRVAVYTPPGYDFELIGPRYPTLYLLPGFDGEPSFNFEYGNETYFLAASIAKVADRLIASGEIKPMFIVMPDASIPYGGSFYANSTLAGKWEDMMSVELVHKIDTLTRTEQTRFWLQNPRRQRIARDWRTFFRRLRSDPRCHDQRQSVQLGIGNRCAVGFRWQRFVSAVSRSCFTRT